MLRRHSAPSTRREFLHSACRCGAALAAVTALPLLPSCASEEKPPGPRVDWSDLPDGSRIIVMDEALPIEVVRRGNEVSARSLLCTHQGCQVQWRPEEASYHCPCHDGVFDPSGRPLMGPPREPLREFAVERKAGYIQIDTRVPGGGE